MARVRSRDTTPERRIRQILTKLGYRYRLHRKDLPGNPDIAFISRRKAIFVNGCFWHGHDCKRGARLPKQNATYWRNKVDRNRARDRVAITALNGLGWKVLVLWECELHQENALTQRLERFLGGYDA